MGKRFTDTDKWTKQWFGDLSIREKVLWLYCCDACDAAGIADFSTKFFSVSVGFPVKKETLDKAFGDRIVWLESSKFFIPSFIEFQYGQLTEACKPHKPIIKELEKLGLLVMENGKGTVRVLKGYSKGINTLKKKKRNKNKKKKQKGLQGKRNPLPIFGPYTPNRESATRTKPARRLCKPSNVPARLRRKLRPKRQNTPKAKKLRADLPKERRHGLMTTASCAIMRRPRLPAPRWRRQERPARPKLTRFSEVPNERTVHFLRQTVPTSPLRSMRASSQYASAGL